MMHRGNETKIRLLYMSVLRAGRSLLHLQICPALPQRKISWYTLDGRYAYAQNGPGHIK
jgi:hypothetical protein